MSISSTPRNIDGTIKQVPKHPSWVALKIMLSFGPRFQRREPHKPITQPRNAPSQSDQTAVPGLDYDPPPLDPAFSLLLLQTVVMFPSFPNLQLPRMLNCYRSSFSRIDAPPSHFAASRNKTTGPSSHALLLFFARRRLGAADGAALPLRTTQTAAPILSQCLLLFFFMEI